MKPQKKPDIQNIYSLTPMQEGMLYNSIAHKGSHAYFEQLSFDVHSEMDVSLLEKSLNAIIQRHEILRSVFNYKKAKRPIQNILKERFANVYYEDLTHIDEKENYIKDFKEKDKEKGFDLSRDILIRLAVFKTEAQTYKLVFGFHHILMDGWCIGIIVKEFFQIYKSLEESKPIELDRVYSYGSYIGWLEKQDRREAREYWRKYLEGYEQQATLPKSGKLYEIGKYDYEDYIFKLDRDLTKGLAGIAGKNNVTINTVFQALWGILLKRYNSLEDVVFGAVVSGRPHEVVGVDKMVGLFINTIPVRVRFEKDKPFNQIIKELQTASLESEKYDYFPLAQIQADTELKQGLLDHILVFENYPLEDEIANSNGGKGLYGYKIDNVEVFEQTSYDFNIMVMPGSEMTVKLSYNALVYQRDFIRNIEGHLKKIANVVLENDGTNTSDIYILTEEEEKRILFDFNNTRADYPREKTIHRLFEEQVERTPDSIALVFGNSTLTHRQFNEKANQLARVLREKGIKPDSIVGIMLERSFEMMIGIMGVLKAGGAYLPIDPEYPADRIKFMLEDSGAGILLSQSKLDQEQLPSDDGKSFKVINLDDEELFAGEGSNLESINTSNDLAYVIYTSGSTGKPKGVMLEHVNVNNFIKGMADEIDFSEGKTILCLTTISFDIFVLESLLPLTRGLKVVIANEMEQKNPQALNEVILKNRVDMLQTTPSRMKMLIDGQNLSCLKDLKEIMVGGEAFPQILKEEICRLSGARIYNVYGPTETTVWSTLKEVTGNKELNIGKPIANTEVYILDRNNRPQPVGVPGELCIAGDGLARGYLFRPELTEEKFIPNPFSSIDKAQQSAVRSPLMYKTGDLARWLPDGNIEFLGRIDHQVKIRGFRIELGEIESQLMKHEGIKEAVVVARDDQGGSKYLCAYIVSEQELNVQELREYLLKTLPDYMIPSYFVLLDRMPQTPNGKIDRKALPKPSGSINTGAEYVEPTTDLEKKLAEIWIEVLGIDRIGINDNFFHLGGHSISMMQITAKISNQLNTDVSIGEFMKHITIAELAGFISKGEDGMAEKSIYPYKEPEPGKMHEPFPLTEVQMAYLMGRDEKFEMGGVSTHLYTEIETELDIDRFNVALRKLIKRHPMLRAIVLPTGQQQILNEVPDYKIDAKDLTGMSSEAMEMCIREERARMSHHIFKADEWPLFEFKAFKLSENKNYLMVGLDMLIADATSMQIFYKEIMDYYREPEMELPELNFTFRDYITAYTQFKEAEKFKEDKKYWMSKLEDFPGAPALPLKTDPSNVAKPHFKRLKKAVPKEDWEIIKKKAYSNRITPSALLCTAYAQVLGFWSNQQKLAVNLTVFNRYPFHQDVDKIIGDFTSVILLDIDLTTKTTFWQKTENVQKTLIDALEHRHYDGVEFIREISRHKNLGTKAAMPIVFTSMLMENKDVKSGINESSYVKMAISQTSQVYIDHQATEENGELVLVWDYVEELFDENIINLMFEQYTQSLDALRNETEDYEISLDSSDMELVEQYNDTDEDIPLTTLHAMFQEQVKRFPDHTAVMFKDLSINYLELDKRSGRVANYLKAQGVRKGDLVGVLARRCIDTIVNVMGILKARAAYVPVDPEYPEDRRAYIMENSGCKLILEPETYIRENIDNFPANFTDGNSHPGDIAYVIYTSGSTGKPKGVIISHGAAANTIIDINQKFNVTENDRIIGLSSMCFDLSVYDIFGALGSGAALVMVEDQRDVPDLVKTVQEKQITIWNSVPAIMDMVAENLDTDFVNNSMRLVMLSGDWIPLRLPGKVKQHFNSAEVISLGGATEASIWSIYYPVKEIKEGWKSIPYGIPLANQTFYVLNFEMKLCPPDVTGELYIGGVGVAEGYMNDEEKTAASFINHPELGKLYKTGDFGVLRRDKEIGEAYIEFLGRKDHQVKIRGYRIELGEIENCLLSHDFVTNASVIDKTDARGKKVLCAYYVSDDEELTTEELRIFLGRQLPEYMIPAYFIQLSEIPLTPNGKVDRNALPMPEVNMEDTYVAPTDDIEKKLCCIWEETLGVEKVGTNDNFFDLGGNSLNVALVISKIQKEFKINIPLREVFSLPTVKQMSEYIKADNSEVCISDDDNMVLLRKGSKADNHLFLIHAGSGEVEGYMEFCNNSRQDFNYWGIRSDRFADYCPQNLTIEGTAAKYLEKIKKMQPRGPYRIAGWCIGGTTAFEIVRQIESSGEKVDFFALINSFAPQRGFYEDVAEFSVETEIEWAQKGLMDKDMKNIIGTNTFTDINKIWPSFIDYAYTNRIEEDINKAIKPLIPHNIAQIVPNFDTINLKGLVYYLNVIRSYANARAIYIPSGKVNVQVYFLEASDSRISNKDVWQEYCINEIKYDEAVGTHFSIFRTPNVAGLAEKFNSNFITIE